MSFMDPINTTKPTSAENTMDDRVLYVEESDNPSEDAQTYYGVEAWIRERFERAKDRRQTDEKRWLMAFRNYRGVYGPEVQFLEDEQSKVFVKITKTKVIAAYAQIVDILFAGNKFPIGVQPKKIPMSVADSVHFDMQGVEDDAGTPSRSATIARDDIIKLVGPLKDSLSRVEDKLKAGPGVTPTAMTWEPARIASMKMEKKIHDQLDQAEADKSLRSVAFEMALFGSGGMAGPFAYDKEYPKWDEEGKYSPEFETIPKAEAMSIWDYYPDPDARNQSEAEYGVRRHRYSKTQLRKLKRRPLFRDEQIEEAIDLGPNYSPEYWEQVLEDTNSTSGEIERYEVLEYWGYIDSEVAEEADLELPEEMQDLDQVQVNAWVCNGQVLRLVLNPFTPNRIPFFIVPYELNPYSIFGIGVAENMEDTQMLMNGFMRLAVDNSVLSSNLLIEIDETNLAPGQDLKLRPGKIIRRMGGAPGQAMFAQKFPNVTQETFMMFDKARQLADESTGIPSFSHGMSGVMGVGRTASGMSMLMGASAQNMKAVVKNMDDYLLGPLGKAMFSFNMQFNFDKDYTQGDLEVVARGTESLMRNEIRSQRLLQFMQMGSNPALAPFVKFDYILRELAASMDLDEDKILNDPREAAIQASLMAQMQAAMGGPPPGQQQGGPPSPNDPTGNGNGNIGPGQAPEPGSEGFSGPNNPNAGPQMPQQQPQQQQGPM